MSLGFQARTALTDVLGIAFTISFLQLWRLIWMLDSLLGLAFFLMWVVLMYKAYNNE